MALTGPGTWWEDFTVGQKIRHARGTTVGEVESQLLTKLVMNTAEGHWNQDVMQGNQMLGEGRVVFGFITASIVIGLATQDTGENSLRELGLDKIRFRSPVHLGDTLYAFTEVLDKSESTRKSGIVHFRHWGLNQKEVIVFEGDRIVLLKRKPAGDKT